MFQWVKRKPGRSTAVTKNSLDETQNSTSNYSLALAVVNDNRLRVGASLSSQFNWFWRRQRCLKPPLPFVPD